MTGPPPSALRTLRTFFAALGLGGQGELFPEPPAAGNTRTDALN